MKKVITGKTGSGGFDPRQDPFDAPVNLGGGDFSGPWQKSPGPEPTGPFPWLGGEGGHI